VSGTYFGNAYFLPQFFGQIGGQPIPGTDGQPSPAAIAAEAAAAFATKVKWCPPPRPFRRPRHRMTGR
jgi:hypothetical protein